MSNRAVQGLATVVATVAVSVPAEFLEVSVGVSRGGVEIFDPVAVIETGRQADIQWVFDPMSAGDGLRPPSSVHPAPHAEAILDGGGMDQRVLLMAQRIEDYDAYTVSVEYLQRLGRHWTSVMQPVLMVSPGQESSIELTTSNGKKWTVAVTLSPRHDVYSFQDVPGKQGTSAVWSPSVAPPGSEEPNYGECCEFHCGSTKVKCCGACCTDGVPCTNGEYCCPSGEGSGGVPCPPFCIEL